MSDNFYPFNKVRDQVLQAVQNRLCTFELNPSDKRQRTKFRDNWTTDCKEYPCTKGWCEVYLDIKIIGFRTRTVHIYYAVKASIACVKLYGTIFDELKKYNIISLNDSDKISNVKDIFPDII